MIRCFIRFSVFFAVILGYFCVTSCQSPNLVWCTSNGILTFNRHTGQFELMWENQGQPGIIKHDTIYVYPDITTHTR